MDEARLQLLSDMAIFGGLARPHLARIADTANQIAVARGELFFREGDLAASLYVLEAGRVDVFKTWKDRRCLLRQLERGDCFGEMALIDMKPRSASVLALEDCVAIEITFADLHELYSRDLEQFTLVHMNLAREISRRLRHSDNALFRVMMGEDVFGEGLVLGGD